MKTYKIYLIRHGFTRANLEGRYCGLSDISLCEEGESALYSLLEQYSYPTPELVYVSPLVRARQTASIIWPECEQILVEDLREASFGRFEGRSFAELKGDEEFEKWVVPDSNYLPEGVEAQEDFFERCSSALQSLIADMMRKSVFEAGVVSHAGVIGNALSALAFPKKPPYDWQCEPGCGFKLIADPTLYLREPVLEVVDYLPFEDGEQR
ncbi:MAG: histidine phosphatase family protein [Oscillospiraceae bacterium]|nr:histidine phosphatase family protein [Oscillospiraceae bacterium]